MGWPQITMIVLLVLETGLHLARHGQPRNTKFDVWVSLLSSGALVGILYAGGFFG